MVGVAPPPPWEWYDGPVENTEASSDEHIVERVPHTLQSALLGMRSRIDRLYERLAEVLETDDPEQVRILTRTIEELEEKEGVLFTQLLESRRLVPADVADAFLRKMAE